MQDSASESIKISKVGKLLRKLGQLYKKRENSEKDKNPALDDAVVEKLGRELGQLYKQCIASKSEKDAVQPKSDGAVVEAASISEPVKCCNHPKY